MSVASKPSKASESMPFKEPKSATDTLLAVLVYSALTVLLIFVLAPLFWMIISAFKTPGTAFQIRFLPKTTVHFPAMENAAYAFPQIDGNSPTLYFNVVNASATTVEAIVRDTSGEVEVVPMVPYFEGQWVATAPRQAGESVEVAYRINNEVPRVDSYIPVTVAATGVTLVGEPRFIAYQVGDKISLTIAQAAGRRLSLNVADRQTAFTGSGDTQTAQLDAPAGASFRITERLTLGEAMGRIYTLENFKTILTNKDFNFGRYLINSLVVATSCALLTVLICAMASFAFVFFEFHYREQIFIALITSMLVPGMIYMVPQFSITLGLGLMDTYSGMVLPHLANVFGLFLLRQYMLQIPRDLFNAAEIDGATDPQIFRTVVIPICLPIMVTLFLLTFVTQWSNFLWQLIVNTGDSKVITLPVGLQQFKGQNANEWEKIMAGACFSVLPISVLFLSLQKYFLEGLTSGSVKE